MKKIIGLFLFLILITGNAFGATNKGLVSAVSSNIRNGKLVVNVEVAYLPTQFSLNGIYLEVDPTLTVAALNNSIQQFCMETINTEVPNAIANKNDCRLMGGFVS